MAVILAFLFFALPLLAQQQPNWINVKNYGTKADTTTDDTPAIMSAIHVALARPQQQGQTVVYFPPSTGYYDIKTPLVLPASNKEITLYFDSPLYIEATVTIGSRYTVHATDGTQFQTGYRVNPAVHIQGLRTTLDNISLSYIHDSSDGIVIDGASSDIKLKDVSVWMAGNNTKGIPLKISGGFRYEIDGGGYNSYGAPSIQFNDNIFRCDYSGIVRLRNNVYLGGHGIQIHNHCGGINSISIDGVVYENCGDAFLTVIVDGGSPVFGVEIRNVNMADSWASPLPPLIDVHSPNGPGMENVTVVNSWTDGLTLTTGAPIYNLEVWSMLRDYAPGILAQPDHFIYHGPHGIKDTMPRLP